MTGKDLKIGTTIKVVAVSNTNYKLVRERESDKKNLRLLTFENSMGIEIDA